MTRKPRKRPSRTARRRMAQAGARNLAAYRERQRETPDEITRQVERFRNDLFVELRPDVLATRRAMAEAACATYGAILLANTKLQRMRGRGVDSLLDRIPRLAGTLLRLLKSLHIRHNSRPRSLAEVFAGKVEQNPEIDGAKPPVSGGKLGKTPQSEGEAGEA